MSGLGQKRSCQPESGHDFKRKSGDNKGARANRRHVSEHLADGAARTPELLHDQAPTLA
jgi:hypothetical protein